MSLKFSKFETITGLKACFLNYKDKGHSVFVVDPKRGNHSLEKELDNFKNNQASSSFKQAYNWAIWDYERCLKNKSYFKKEAFKSHFFLNDIKDYNEDLERDLREKSFSSLKYKINQNTPLDLLKNSLEKTKIKWRLDFNFSYSFEEFLDFCNSFKNVLDKIEFIEDPFSYDEAQWNQVRNEFNIKLALDEKPNNFETFKAIDILVIKAIREDVDFLIKSYKDSEVKFVSTHFMDHPIGQLIACQASERILNQLGEKRLLDGGLLSQSLSDKFSFLSSKDSYLRPEPHLEWGFYIKNANWENL